MIVLALRSFREWGSVLYVCNHWLHVLPIQDVASLILFIRQEARPWCARICWTLFLFSDSSWLWSLSCGFHRSCIHPWFYHSSQCVRPAQLTLSYMHTVIWLNTVKPNNSLNTHAVGSTCVAARSPVMESEPQTFSSPSSTEGTSHATL